MAERRDAMFRGEKINVTENRAVLHVALRAPRGEVDRWSTATTWCRTFTRCSTGWRRSPTRCGAARGPGHTGKRIRNVINIGIGGSYLGPEMAYQALRPYSRARHDLPLRLQRRRRRLRRGDARPRPRRDAVHHLVQDLHHAGDHDQRARPRAPGLVEALGDERPRSPSISSPCPPTPRGWRSSASTPPTCSASGTGSAAATRWTRRSASRP